MARTAHHPSRGRRRFRACMLKGQPWHAVVLHDLRYSTRDVSEAVREGRRPRPHPVRRAVEVYAFPRHQGDGSVAREAAVEERRARQRLRRRAGTLLRLVDSPGGVIDLDAADLVDIPPARHRRGGLWLA